MTSHHLSLITLPIELQILIIGDLDIQDLNSLVRTCKHFEMLISRNYFCFILHYRNLKCRERLNCLIANDLQLVQHLSDTSNEDFLNTSVQVPPMILQLFYMRKTYQFLLLSSTLNLQWEYMVKRLEFNKLIKIMAIKNKLDKFLRSRPDRDDLLIKRIVDINYYYNKSYTKLLEISLSRVFKRFKKLFNKNSKLGGRRGNISINDLKGKEFSDFFKTVNFFQNLIDSNEFDIIGDSSSRNSGDVGDTMGADSSHSSDNRSNLSDIVKNIDFFEKLIDNSVDEITKRENKALPRLTRKKILTTQVIGSKVIYSVV